jgi:hypothetical protein
VSVVRVEIGEVAVRGFGAVDGDRVRAAIVRELEHVAATDPAWPRARSGGARLDAGRAPLGRGASADDIGAAVARAVQRGLR